MLGFAPRCKRRWTILGQAYLTNRSRPISLNVVQQHSDRRKIGAFNSLWVGFLVGALVPIFWGVLGFLLFNVPEGRLSRAFWQAVYITCPFWRIDGEKAMILMPLLNGLMYAGIAFFVVKAFIIVRSKANPGVSSSTPR
jgi:hypothetical protein